MMDKRKYFPLAIVSGVAVRGLLYPVMLIKTRHVFPSLCSLVLCNLADFPFRRTTTDTICAKLDERALVG